MRVQIRYSDQPDWDEIVEVDTWNDLMGYIGCTCTSLTVLEDDDDTQQ